MKYKLAKSIAILSLAIMSAFACGVKSTATDINNTTTTDNITDDTQHSTPSYNTISSQTTTYMPYFDHYKIEFDKNGEFRLYWLEYPNYYYDEITGVTYEYELAADETFTQIIDKGETAKPEYILKNNLLGEAGGTYHFRSRAKFVTTHYGTLYSRWSEDKSFTCYAINNKNFPGIYKILKNGGQMSTLDGEEDVTYDKNGDGWLDEAEIFAISSLSTGTKKYTKNGITHYDPTYKISSLDGIEKLPNLVSITLTHYSGKKIDLSKNKVRSLRVTGIRSRELTVIAPDAHSVDVEPHHETKFKKLDLSRCDKAVEIYAYGEHKTKTLKLPKEKNYLRVLSIAEISAKTLNLNKYKNLQQVYIYNSDVSNLKVNKCKNLRYLYFYFTNKIKSVDVKACKKLRGMDICNTPSLATSKVKAPAKTKITRGKGKWWYQVKAYKNDMKKLNELKVEIMTSDN